MTINDEYVAAVAPRGDADFFNAMLARRNIEDKALNIFFINRANNINLPVLYKNSRITIYPSFKSSWILKSNGNIRNHVPTIKAVSVMRHTKNKRIA